MRSQAANLLIFDEASFLDEELYITASALVRTTNGIIYAISTVNVKTPKNWFYYELVSAELDKYNADGEKYGKRVTLEENPFIPEHEKEKIREDGKRNMKMFGAEWMAEFQEFDEFDLSNFRNIDYKPTEYMVNGIWRVQIKAEALQDVNGKYTSFLIAYDSAKLKDKPGVMVYGSTKD